MGLKQCPFCGSEAHHKMAIGAYGPETFRVGCSNSCCIIFPQTPNMKTKEAAIEVWNRGAKHVDE